MPTLTVDLTELDITVTPEARGWVEAVDSLGNPLPVVATAGTGLAFAARALEFSTGGVATIVLPSTADLEPAGTRYRVYLTRADAVTVPIAVGPFAFTASAGLHEVAALPPADVVSALNTLLDGAETSLGLIRDQAVLARDAARDAADDAATNAAGGSGSSALIVVSGGTVDLPDAQPNGYLIGYKVTAPTTIEGVSFAAGSYIFERDSGVYGGWTYRTLDTATQVVPSPESVPPTAGTLAASAITDTTATVTVTGAADETGLGVAPYDFSADNGATWTGYQASPEYNWIGLTPATEYQMRHRVKDAAGNVTVGTAITVTTSAASLAPSDVGTLFFDYDASTSMTLYGDVTNVQQLADGTAGARHLIAADSGSAPNKVTLNGKDAAQFTPANSDRLRYVGSYTLAASTGYTVCWVGRIDTLANAVLLSAVGMTIRMTLGGVVNANSGTATAQLLPTPAVSAGGTYLITAAVTTGGVTLRVGAAKDVETGTTVDATNNLALSALYSGTGSEFAAVTVGRAWGYAKAISDAEHEGLRAWAQGEWGAA